MKERTRNQRRALGHVYKALETAKGTNKYQAAWIEEIKRAVYKFLHTEFRFSIEEEEDVPRKPQVKEYPG